MQQNLNIKTLPIKRLAKNMIDYNFDIIFF